MLLSAPVLLTGCLGGLGSRREGRPSAQPDLAYQARLLSTSPPTVEISLRVAGSAAGVTTLGLSDDWKAEATERRILDLSAVGASGRNLPVIRELGARWTATHAPGEMLALRYRLAAGERPPRASNYEVMITPEFCLLFAASALLYPQHLRGDTPHRIAFRWAGFRDADWSVASSRGLGDLLSFTDTDEGFEYSTFLAAPSLAFAHRTVGAGVLTVALVGSRWKLSGDVLADDAVRILGNARRFFSDPGPPLFFISAVPVGAYDERGGSFSGTALTNGFALLLPPPARYDRFGEAVRMLLAHEGLHNWFGHTIRSDEPSGSVAWFFEGFTTFYTRRLNYRGGLISLEKLVEDLNSAVESYVSSPERNLSAEEMADQFRREKRMSRVAYLRGDLIALVTDYELRNASRGKRSLDHLVRELADAGRAGMRVSTASLIETIARETSPGFGARLRATVTDGASWELPPDVLSPCLRLVDKGGTPAFHVDRPDACPDRL